MKDNGKSYRQISDKLSEKGHQVSKSSIQKSCSKLYYPCPIPKDWDTGTHKILKTFLPI